MRGNFLLTFALGLAVATSVTATKPMPGVDIEVVDAGVPRVVPRTWPVLHLIPSILKDASPIKSLAGNRPNQALETRCAVFRMSPETNYQLRGNRVLELRVPLSSATFLGSEGTAHVGSAFALVEQDSLDALGSAGRWTWLSLADQGLPAVMATTLAP